MYLYKTCTYMTYVLVKVPVRSSTLLYEECVERLIKHEALLYVYGAFQTANKSDIVSPSLLQISLDLDIHLPSQFDVGMDDWMSPPCEKKARILGDATNSQTG